MVEQVFTVLGSGTRLGVPLESKRGMIEMSHALYRAIEQRLVRAL